MSTSSTLRFKVINGFYKGKSGVINGRLPGGNFFKVQLDDGKLTALHVTEFERIPNNHILHNEKVEGFPVRRKNK